MLRIDCKHYNGYKPCQNDSKCDNCTDFRKEGLRVLIVRMNQLGNIIKSTPILDALKKKYGECEIWWMTSPSGKELLEHDPRIFSVVTEKELLHCQQTRWDAIISLENDPRCAAIASSMHTNGIPCYGFFIAENGKIKCHENSWQIGRLSLSDEFRFQTNRKPLHELYFEMLGVPYEGEKTKIFYTEEEGRRADRGLREHEDYFPLIGLFTGGNNNRFPTKSWPEEKWIALAQKVRQWSDGTVLLLGGKEDFDRNQRIANASLTSTAIPPMSLREFCAFIECLDCVVATDSFGLQAAVAMETPVVGLFGPTPEWEIPVFGRGRKVVAEKTCGPCYKRFPDECVADCMSSISVQDVAQAVMTVLEETRAG